MISGLKKREVSKEELQALFKKLTAKVLEFCSPLRIIVFGSYASGNIRESSDLDVCLIFDTREEAKAAEKKILSEPPLVGIATDYLFMSEKRFGERKNFGGVCVEIAAKGVVIYERRVSSEPT